MANRFVLNETSYHGAGAIKSIPGEIKARGFAKVFVATDPDLIKFGVAKKVTDILDNAGIEYGIYSDIKANPTIENVKATAANYAVNVAASAAGSTIEIENSDLTGLNTVNVAAANVNVTIDNSVVNNVDNTAVESYATLKLSIEDALLLRIKSFRAIYSSF